MGLEVGPHGRGCYRTGQREVSWDVVVKTLEPASLDSS